MERSGFSVVFRCGRGCFKATLTHFNRIGSDASHAGVWQIRVDRIESALKHEK